MSKADQYARKAAGWSDAEYADAHAYLAHRAELCVSLGDRLDRGDEVLDLACGNGGLGSFLLSDAGSAARAWMPRRRWWRRRAAVSAAPRSR